MGFFEDIGQIAAPLNAVALGPIAQFGSTVYQNDRNRDQTRDTNLMNAGINQTQQNFQEYMSNSAHQREVKDLIAAGLNPTMSAGGNGSSTPSGASATAVAPPNVIMPDFLQIASMAQEQQKIGITQTQTAAAVAKSLSDTELNKMKKILAQKGLIRANVEGEASAMVQQFMNYMKRKTGYSNQPKNTQPLQQNSSGGSLP